MLLFYNHAAQQLRSQNHKHIAANELEGAEVDISHYNSKHTPIILQIVKFEFSSSLFRRECNFRLTMLVSSFMLFGLGWLRELNTTVIVYLCVGTYSIS
jgi:hypothetical protein